MKPPIGVDLDPAGNRVPPKQPGHRRFLLPTDALSPREAEVCLLLREGMMLKEIAGHLGIAHRTVEHHARNLYQKLKVRSRAELFKHFESCHTIEVRPAPRDSDVVQILQGLERIEEQLSFLTGVLGLGNGRAVA